jgi:hypothetical protein
MMHFKGPTVIGTSLEDSYRHLKNLQFTGSKANFSFGNFVDQHVKAYLSIKRLSGDEEVISNKKKVHDFLSRIQMTNAMLLSARVQVMANPAMYEDFTACCDFMRQIARTILKSYYLLESLHCLKISHHVVISCDIFPGPSQNLPIVLAQEKHLMGAASSRNDTAGLTSTAVPHKQW